MEASALTHAQATALVGRSPLLRLQGDEKLIALIRKGHHGAFEALVQRYQSRLIAFCRHMLGSQEDAEDVLQEVFASAFNAICADERPINARPWLYRIARNRCLNHLRRPVPTGLDSMDVFERDGGTTTADTVHKREEFRQIVSDVQDLPETQRTALLLREIDALSYEQIAEAMDTTVPSVKSLLVRARVSLAEAAEARLLTCEEVRLELGQVAEGIVRSSAPVRRHLRSCERCRVFKGELRKANRALAAIYPLGPMVILKKLVIAKLGIGAAGGAAAGGSAAAGGVTLAGGAAAGAGATSGAIGAGVSAVASKAAAGLAAAAIVTGAAVEVKQVTREAPVQREAAAVAAAPVLPPRAVAAKPQPAAPAPATVEKRTAPAKKRDAEPAAKEPVVAPAPTPKPLAQEPAATQPNPAPPTDKHRSTAVLPVTAPPQPTEPEPVMPVPQEPPPQPAPAPPPDQPAPAEEPAAAEPQPAG